MYMQSDEVSKTGESVVYQIRISGQLEAYWSSRFEGLSITLDDSGDTLLTGPVVDQAALHGLLKIVRDSGMTLVSVMRLENGKLDAPDNN